jgi:phage-related tail protein
VGEERRAVQRRRTDRNAKAGDALDVSRIEYETLFAEVTKSAQLIARIEQEVGVLREALNRLRAKKVC